MFIDHFEIKAGRFDECVRFYKAVLKPLGIELKWSDELAAGFGPVSEPNVRFLIEAAESPAKCHIAFAAGDENAVSDFYKAGIAIGARGNGEPGLRTAYAPNYYAAFLHDPDGNNIEAVVYL